jgi:hypothetical protein
MKTNIKIKNEAILAYLRRTATLCPIPGLYETLKLGKTALSPEMVREAVPHWPFGMAFLHREK